MENAHDKSSSEVLKHFDVNENNGLTPEQVRNNLEKYGPNGELHAALCLFVCLFLPRSNQTPYNVL